VLSRVSLNIPIPSQIKKKRHKLLGAQIQNKTKEIQTYLKGKIHTKKVI
jgi:hypothetical protein